MSDQVLQQDLNKEEARYRMPMAQLLFRERPKNIDICRLKADFEKLAGETDLLSASKDSSGNGDDMCTLAVRKYTTEFKEAKKPVPAFANFLQPMEFKSENIGVMERSQLWDVPDGNELLDSAEYTVTVFSMMSMGLTYTQQAELFVAQVEAALPQYPDCIGIYVASAGKLTMPQQFMADRQHDLGVRFLKLAVNARFFNIQGGGNSLVDTLGLCAIGMPDVQVHFHTLNPNDVVQYVYNIASYQFDNGFPIENGDPIDGLGTDGRISLDVQWKAQYEDALIQPPRVVLDINCGEFAAKTRD